MRVLLIDAPPRQIVERRNDTPEFNRLSVAVLARTSRPNGHVVARIDATFECLSYDDRVARAELFKPDLVGLATSSNEAIPPERVAAQIKQAIRGVAAADGALVTNKSRMHVGDQDTIPMPAGRESTVLTARGCPSLAGSA